MSQLLTPNSYLILTPRKVSPTSSLTTVPAVSSVSRLSNSAARSATISSERFPMREKEILP